MLMKNRIRPIARPLAAAVIAALLAVGCPPGGPSGSTDYDAGFLAGFAADERYWDGYFDGWDTIDDLDVFYDTSDIPFIDNLSFDAGFWDGVWYAYNDGYFVDYTYAFVIGFSEGYDNAFWSDYLTFLENDFHIEYDNGGWGDGYEDGYTEGRVFGANDFEQGLPFDWLGALLDYQSGTDLYFAEIDVGTGVNGPAILYEYGVDPLAKSTSAVNRDKGQVAKRTIRNPAYREKADLSSQPFFRPFNSEAADLLDFAPLTSLRDPTELRLETTWLERVDDYVQAETGFKRSVQRARAKAE
jgi:hypothetical protein